MFAEFKKAIISFWLDIHPEHRPQKTMLHVLYLDIRVILNTGPKNHVSCTLVGCLLCTTLAIHEFTLAVHTLFWCLSLLENSVCPKSHETLDDSFRNRSIDRMISTKNPLGSTNTTVLPTPTYPPRNKVLIRPYSSKYTPAV